MVFIGFDQPAAFGAYHPFQACFVGESPAHTIAIYGAIRTTLAAGATVYTIVSYFNSHS
jgi:hypothetical protein